MGVNIDWSLGKMPDIGGNALRAFETGARVADQARKARDQRDRRKAVAAATSNPDDPEALKAVMALDPELGMKLETRARDNAFRSAATDYATPQPSALSMFRGGEPNDLAGMIDPTPPTASTVPVNGGNPAARNALAAFGQPQGAWPAPDQAPQLPDSGQQQSPVASVVSIVGKPANREDALFLKMFQADPKRALEMESGLRDRMMDRLKDEHEGIGYGLTALAGVDASTYSQRRAHIMQRLAPLKLNLEAVLPEQFPGEEGIRQIQMQGMGLKDQLATLISQDKADAYVEDIDADNERADRNTASIIADRGARRDIQRRGQDIRSTDTRRGQDRRGSGRSGLVQVKTRVEAEALPPGTKFRDPNGVVRTRP